MHINGSNKNALESGSIYTELETSRSLLWGEEQF